MKRAYKDVLIFGTISFEGIFCKANSKLSQSTIFEVIGLPHLKLVSKELNQLAAILHVYAGGLNFIK